MTRHRIALYPGDGIGPEVMATAVRVLNALQEVDTSFELQMTTVPWGSRHALETGAVVPAEFLETLRPFDAILFGALGDPARIPDHVTLEPLVRIRQAFDQYACVRPARLYPGVKCPLSGVTNIDMVIVRENSEGEYFSCGGRFKPGHPREVAVQTAVHTSAGVTRILRFAFELAMKRRRRLTMASKSNALRYAMVMWDDLLEQVRRDFPDVQVEKLHVDAAAMDFVRRPGHFDVVVGSNLFGDILSDLSAAITGGLGTAASANINPDRTFPSMFEPVHGSAPDIAGRGIANPAAMILSAAAMLDWLELSGPAVRLRRALEATLLLAETTPDLGGKLTTSEVADRVAYHLLSARHD